jgi:phage replication O-like protein O
LANPQLENGHVKIATDIWEKLCKFRIPGELRQVFDAVIRKTYGWNKKADAITLGQFMELTEMGKPNICRALSKLITHNIIKSDNGKYSLQKDFEKWVPFGVIRSDNVIKSDNEIIKSDNESLSEVTTEIIKSDNALHINQKTLTKDTTKDTLTKDMALRAFAVCSTFEDYKNLSDAYQDKVAFLVNAFKKLHSNAPDIDMEKCGGRIAGMYGKKGKDTGFILKIIWDTASMGIAGSHLDYIDAVLFKNYHKGNGHKNINTGNNGRRERDPDKYIRGRHGHVVH